MTKFEVKGFLVGLCKGVLQVAFVKFLALGLTFGPFVMGWWFFFYIIWHELCRRVVIEGLVMQLGSIISIDNMKIFYLIQICTPYFSNSRVEDDHHV
jgi:hypothetical protein